MKILIISESINVEDSSGSKVNVALIQNLKKAGYIVRVLHFSHKIIYLNGIECILINEIKLSVNFLFSRLIRIFQKYSKIIINDRVESIFGFSFTHSNDTNSIVNGIKNNIDFNPDLVITLSKGASFRPHRAMLKLPQLHHKWLAYIHDPYPFHFYPRPYNWVERSYKHKEKFVLDITEKSKFLAFPSLLLKDWMQSYFPEVENKSVVIPHQINDAIEIVTIPDFFKINKFSLLHAGNLLPQRNPEFLLKGYMNFLMNNPEAIENSILYLIGNNDHHQKLLSDYANHDNFVIKKYLEYKIVQTLEINASSNIILEAISEISPFLPGKFPNCVKANKPIIILSPYHSEVKRLLGKDYPYWSKVNDVVSIEAIIKKLYLQWKQNPSQCYLNRPDLKYYCEEQSLKKVIDQLFYPN